MNYNEIYQQKLGTLDGALSLIKSGDTIATPIFGNEPTHFISKLHTIAPDLEDVVLWTMLMNANYPIMTDNSLKGHVDIYTYFFNNNCRDGHASGRFNLMPSDLHRTSGFIDLQRRPNIFVAAVSPMDQHGNVYLSFELQNSLDQLEHADTIIFEINSHIPRVFGETAISIEKATYIYEADTPLPLAPCPPITKADEKIAEYVTSLINDGDCIQLGIGGMPNAVGHALKVKHDLGIHTEMLTASMGELIRCGAVNNSRKQVGKGKTVAAFAWGDQALYDTMAENPNIMMRRCSWVNNPFIIAQNDNVVSVNTAIQIDLTGQICSESIGTRQFSGTGGSLDFAYGAAHSKGGRGIVAINSTAKHDTISKIQPVLTPGSAVSIPRDTADYVITEFGIAPLKGRTIRQRVENLIAVAHPNFREELRKQANALMLW